jgi:hypothetical protein
MIDIVTVVFQDELSVLKVQAQSVEIYCQGLGIKNVYVVVNDSDDLVQEIDTAWWGSLQSQVRIIPRSIFGCNYVDNGWLSQQVLKLLAASLSHNTWSMVLDAKTIVTDYMHADTFIAGPSQLKLGTHPISSVFKQSADIVSRLFKIEVDQVAAPAGIPFIFNNDSVREMIAEVTKRTKKSFAVWFQEQGMLTEFILYTGYIKYKYTTLDAVYLNQTTTKLCNNVCHSEIEQFDKKLNWSKESSSLVISVHRNAWANLTVTQKQNYIEYLTSRGIDQAQILL